MSWRIGEILLRKKELTWEQLEQALKEQENSGELLGEILLKKGVVSKTTLYRALAEQYSIRFVDLKRTRLNPKALDLIPQSIALRFQIMPVDIQQNTLIIAISSPLNAWPEHEIRELTMIEHIRTVLALPEDIEHALRTYFKEVKKV